jgi:hypothetical protein
MRNISDRSGENQSASICSINLPWNRAVYEIMWKNVVQPDSQNDNIIRRMRFVCLVIKATDTH